MTTAPDTGPFVHYEVADHIVTITIDRPEARNAIDGRVAAGLEAAMDALEADDDVWVAILTAVAPVFCAGADLHAVARGEDDLMQTKRGGFAGITWRERTKPLIAAMEGPALAGGAEIVLACDLIVASSTATFGLPEVKRGLVAAGGGTFRLGRKIPVNLAMEAALTGDPIDCATAARHGLVNAACDPGEALETALTLARRITTNPPIAVRETRAIVLEGTWADDATAWKRSAQATATIKTTEDVHEGVKAFFEKRPPVWSGR